MKLTAIGCWLWLAASLLAPAVATAAQTEATYPGGNGADDDRDLEVLTSCQMFIYSSLVLRIYDLSSIENLAKSKLCGVERQYAPAQSLEEVAQLYADYGMEKVTKIYNFNFDVEYAKRVLELTEIIIKSYQTGYEKALRQQIDDQREHHAFCTAFIHKMQLENN